MNCITFDSGLNYETEEACSLAISKVFYITLVQVDEGKYPPIRSFNAFCKMANGKTV